MSNNLIEKYSNNNYEELQNKLRDNIYGDKITYWNTKAQVLKKITRETIEKLQELKELNTILGDSINLIKRKYLDSILSLDTSINSNAIAALKIFSSNYNSKYSPQLNMLKAINDVLVLESYIVLYFNNKTGMIIEYYTRFTSITTQNVNHLKSGEYLEVYSGIGSFTLASNPTFLINSDTMKVDESGGYATYRLKVSGKGKKTANVKIIFTDNKGLKDTVSHTITYFVNE